jgi:iron-sulfur cluster assembly protein/iron-sulfur cluster insertion protein
VTTAEVETPKLKTAAPATGGVMIVTDAAAAKVAELISQEEEQNLFLRVAVRPGGCSGLSYEMFFDSEKSDDDVATAVGGIEVAVDPASAPYLMGATLDYKDGLQGAGFAINNPNVTKSCGCGNSFS